MNLPPKLTPHKTTSQNNPPHLTPQINPFRPTIQNYTPHLTVNRSPQQSNPPTLTPQQQNNTKQHNEINPATIKNQTDKVDSKLKILQINLNGISNKIKELELLIHDTKADIITIQETKLTSNSKTPKINNYTEIRKDRTYNKGGGLLTYIKNNITFTNDKIPQNINQKLIEIQLVTIHLTPKKFQIANIYIPPSNTTNQNQTNEDNDITQCLNHITSTPNSILTGDINAHSTLWNSNTNDHRGNIIADIIQNSNHITLNTNTHTRFPYAKNQNPSSPDITSISSNLYPQT